MQEFMRQKEAEIERLLRKGNRDGTEVEDIFSWSENC